MPPILSFVGSSGSGKTTVLEKIISHFTTQHISVGVLKSSHHNLTFDTPGKDSYRFREAGATSVVVAAPTVAISVQTILEKSPPETFLPYFSDVDLVLVEGFTHFPLPKIEVWRKDHSAAPVFLQDPHLIAVVSDDSVSTAVPVFSFSSLSDITTFISNQFLSKGAL